jgi:MoaA/NifB/PqqE/SkfB family radical SAM enzyme
MTESIKIDGQSHPAAYSGLRSASQSRLDLAIASPLPAPMTIYVEPTKICNFRCTYCPESFPDYKNKAGGLFKMGLPEFELISSQIAELGRLKTLNFYMMGEPFSNKLLPDFISIAKRKNIADRVIVTSNGTLLDKGMSRRVMDSGLDYLRISIYGATQERMTAVTQNRFLLSKVRANIKTLYELRNLAKRKKPAIYVKMIDSLDVVENSKFLDLFSGICDESVIEPVMNWDDPEEGNLSGLSSKELSDSAYFRHKKSVCPFPFYTLVIHSDLKVSVCCVDWAKRAIVGNLAHQSLREIWLGDALRDFRIAHLSRQRHTLEACKNCSFLHTAPDNLDALTTEEYLRRIERPLPQVEAG